MGLPGIETGTVLNDRYRIEAVLGRGGMGNVYLATHLQLGRPVAVKEMTVEMADAEHQEAALRSFRNEAQILADLNHSLLPRVHDFFIAGKHWFLVMDYIRGRSLAQIVEAEEPLEEFQVREWANSLCDVLEYLHNHKPRVIFRDLKPSNIMLDTEGRVRLIDFGVSKIFDSSNEGRTQTFARHSGSPGFAAPEQYSYTTDPRSDIYSLGATLYALLCRRVPPPSISVATGQVQCPTVRSLRPDVSVEFSDAVAKMMHVKAAERPQSIAEVRRLLPAMARPARVAVAVTPPSAPPPLDAADTTAPLAATARPAPSLPKLAAAPTAMLDDNATTRLETPEDPVPSHVIEIPIVLVVGVVVGIVLLFVGLFSLLHRHGHQPIDVPQTAQLDVESTPVGAKVYVDDILRGITPLKLDGLAPLSYVVRIEAPGYERVRQAVTLESGDQQTLQVPLNRASYQVFVSAVPSTADLVVDGQLHGPVGEGGLALPLSGGAHVLEFRNAGYQTAVRRFRIDATTPPQRVDVELHKD